MIDHDDLYTQNTHIAASIATILQKIAHIEIDLLRLKQTAYDPENHTPHVTTGNRPHHQKEPHHD